MKIKNSYQEAGVDLDKAKIWKEQLSLKMKNQMGGRFPLNFLEGGFAGIYEHPNFKDRYLLGACDGVGTKIILAQELNEHFNIGLDVVSMNINDVLSVGGRGLFFLDYISVCEYDIDVLSELMDGIIKGCADANMILLGGETAQMNNFYHDTKVYDIAGMIVGEVNKDQLRHGKNIIQGDVVVGLTSNGFHANGFSLIRKVLERLKEKGVSATKLNKLKSELLTPTTNYFKIISPLLGLYSNEEIKALAHITGGGWRNIERIKLGPGLRFHLPMELRPRIDQLPTYCQEILNFLMNGDDKNDMTLDELYEVFNMGIGLVMVIDRTILEKVSERFPQEGVGLIYLGEIK
jgi:phosphoribosylformylglycinamidine cyclo-ligase